METSPRHVRYLRNNCKNKRKKIQISQHLSKEKNGKKEGKEETNIESAETSKENLANIYFRISPTYSKKTRVKPPHMNLFDILSK